MASLFPLLVFPQAKTIVPPKGKGFPQSQPHLPGHDRQVDRLDAQLTTLKDELARYKANISGSVAGLEPETVLVIEIAGSINDFRQAVEAIGLEWLGEWDIDDIEPDEEFFERNKKGEKTDKPVKGRMFLSLSNEDGMQELLSLWERWQRNEALPNGKTKWRDVFNQTLHIRRWGIEETLRETGMLDHWRYLVETIIPDQLIHCQIELFYRQSPEKRRQNEVNINALLAPVGGRTLSAFIDMPDIAFHAVKAELPADRIRQLLSDLNSDRHDTDIQLFKFHGVMYFRPTGQSLTVVGEGDGEEAEFPQGEAELPPVAAILDGAPNLQHQALKGRLLFDDPDNLAAQYQPGEKKHGTAMASLVVHGELVDGQSDPLQRLVYVLPIMQPDPNTRNRDEHIPDEVFLEDRIERAVRRMYEGEGNTPAQAPSVRVINLSIGDPARPFIHTPSPWARLLDWLAWKYRVLFCVSAGNYLDDIDLGIPHQDYVALTEGAKIEHVLKCIEAQLSSRRILSPSESINALSVGAIHADSAGDYHLGQRTDLLPHSSLFSPAARVGHGFRRSLKPEILFPGGRQLYRTPALDNQSFYALDGSLGAPGQKVAWDSNQAGDLSKTAYTRGTSNATALATRSGARIYEVLNTLRTEQRGDLPEELTSVLIKTLLVHGAKHDDEAHNVLTSALKTPGNSRRFKEVKARYLGYGAVDIDRVLACTEQRGTVLGCGEISENEIHEYRLPLPPGLAGSQVWRRMVVTLAWFTPINPAHQNLREAKLELSPGDKWDQLPLKLARQDADHNQVLRGTVQHEVVEGTQQIAAYQDGEGILLHVTCKKDATAHLDHAIPYGLAVTLEVAEGVEIPIYEQLRARLKPQVAVGVGTGNS